MPGKFFTQSACVLCSAAPALDVLERALGDFEIARRFSTDRERQHNWMGGFPGLLVGYRPEVNGHVLVDVVDQPWPDHMGDPEREALLFNAWAMGWFGPHVFPGGLARAVEHAWSLPAARETVDAHRAFVRIKLSYALGAGDDAPLWPEGRDAVDEIDFVTDIAQAAMTLPSALCYWNPNGEALHSSASIDEIRALCAPQNVLPLALWTSLRVFDPCLAERWTLQDSIGMAQFPTLPTMRYAYRPTVTMWPRLPTSCRSRRTTCATMAR